MGSNPIGATRKIIALIILTLVIVAQTLDMLTLFVNIVMFQTLEVEANPLVKHLLIEAGPAGLVFAKTLIVSLVVAAYDKIALGKYVALFAICVGFYGAYTNIILWPIAQ